MSDRLSPQREAEIVEHLAATTNWSIGNLAARDLLAELAAVRKERDEQRERALDALNRRIEDGREVCADCGRSVPDGPCGVHSPDAVFQRAAREAARLRAERDEARAELAKRPNRYRATPAEVDWFLRKILTEDTLLNYQRAIGNRAVEEAAKDQRADTNLRQLEGEQELATYGRELADLIDPLKDGGHYPSQLLCAKHNGFNPCPGAPRCTPREDEEAGR
jgi:hypothetical protein